MIPLTVNDETAAILGGYADAVEIKDERGRLIGHFLPFLDLKTRDFYEHPEKYIDLAESERRAAAAKHQKGYTFDEVMQRLRSLDKGQ
jgi:hypothetical protein